MTMNQSRLMPRAKILVEAVRQITDIKEKVYGDPKVNLSCSGELKRVFLRYAARSPRQIGPAEQDAIDQALSKIARIATGPVIHEDNYTDCAAYVALAFECAILGSREPSGIMAEETEEEDVEVNLTAEDFDESDLPNDAVDRPEERKDLLGR